MGIAIFFVYLVPPTLLSLSRIVVALGLQDSTWSLQAAAVLVAVPIALVFNLFLNRFIADFTQGAVKG